MGPSSRCTPSRPRHPSRPRDATTARQTATPSTAPPANLRRILRERQSARNRKACLPCRERKVKCDQEQPCRTCVKREHPDLCFYREPGNSKVSNRFQQEPSLHGPSSPETTGESPNNNWVAGNRDAREVDNGSTGAGHTGSSEGQIPTPSLLGDNSIIALVRRDSVQPPTENERRTAFEAGIFPLLGIDMNAQEGRSPHSHLAQDGNPNSSLPDDQEMIELFSFYRDRVHPFSFVLDDLDEIEKMVCSLVNQDMEAWQCDSTSLCLLHAILAAGAQYSNLALAVQLPKYQKYCKLSKPYFPWPRPLTHDSETRFELSRHIRLPEEPFQEADPGSPDSGSCFTERHEPSSSLDPRRHHNSTRTIIGSSSA
ncbi:uncharacterized protein NECHADRAFT_98164 [Fusarium vanettenii 77-13-4]|uniref:Zn(2)-C6 fungal-type domain-containing protein n=2 Tax=Fusarium solani species complex TaxID=232080 RepID=C7ZC11_FUSV7